MDKNNKFTFIKILLGFSLSSWINAILSLFATPIVTRTFTPAELGKINLFITFSNAFLNFAYLGIDQAYTRYYYEPPGKNDNKSLLTICFVLSGIIALVIALGIFIFHDIISKSIIGYAGIVIPITLIISIIAQIIIRYFNLTARMQKNIALFNIQAITTTIISNMSYVVVTFYDATAENAIIFRTALLFIAACVFFLIAFRSSMSFKIDLNKTVIKYILLYAIPICPSAVLATLNNSIGQILMKTYVDYSAVGIYSNAVTVAAIITIIQSGFNSYWSPFVFENYKTQQKKIIKVHHMMSFVIIVFALVVICFQDIIYFILIGKMYWASKQIFPLLLISPVAYTISETLGIGIQLSKKTFLNIPVYVVNVLVNISLCIILLPCIGVVGAALASAVSSICMLIVKACLGEIQYRCSDNYKKLIIALFVFVATAVIHIFIYLNPIKYVIYFVALIIICCLYSEQLKELVKIFFDIIKKLFIKK